MRTHDLLPAPSSALSTLSSLCHCRRSLIVGTARLTQLGSRLLPCTTAPVPTTDHRPAPYQYRYRSRYGSGKGSSGAPAALFSLLRACTQRDTELEKRDLGGAAQSVNHDGSYWSGKWATFRCGVAL